MNEMDDIVREFIVETSENLDQADCDMVNLESNPADRELLSRVFRTIHTIKGACGFLGYDDLCSLAHNAESLLSLLRDGRLSLTEEMVSALLATFDSVKSFIACLENDADDTGEIDRGLIATLARLADTEDGTPDRVSEEVAPADYALASSVNVDCSARTLRIDVKLIDRLMDVVGELVLNRNRIARIASITKDSDFLNATQRLSHVTDEMQEGIMKIRMQPISAAWGTIPRLVRDLAVSCGKKVHVHLEGSDTELDKSVIEAIKNPLVHLVRNVVDHGIEDSETRVAKAKPETGSLRLRAYHEGGQVIIEIADDGRGIDVDGLRERAIANRLIDKSRADRMSRQELTNLVFLPGISTAQVVSSVSGRGVGMDIVKTNIEAIGGTVDIHSPPDQGTRTRIKIPLTLAIVPAITVECCGERFAIPQVHLQELVRLDSDSIELIHDAPVFRLRDRLIPLVFLTRELELDSCDGVTAADEKSKRRQLVVLDAGGDWFGLVVDEIGNPEEIVVKPLPPQVQGIPAFSGTAIIGDGRVALVLDVLGLAQQASVITEFEDQGIADQAPDMDGEELRDSYLIVEVEDDHRAAIPIVAVERLESLPRASVEKSSGGPVVQYAGEVIPLHRLGQLMSLPTSKKKDTDSFVMMICREHGRAFAISIERVLDIATGLSISLGNGETPGLVGTAIIKDRVTDVLDLGDVLKSVAGRTVESEVL